MSPRTLGLSDDLYDYILSVSVRETETQRALRKKTEEQEWAIMQISPDQGQFMGLLVELMGARRTIEIGTFTGYSALCVALHLPDDGQVVACDVDAETTLIAREYWKKAGVASKIDLRIGPALDTLDDLLKNEGPGGFDFAFIDADKTNYANYYQRCLELVRPGGLIAIDNVLWGGDVVDPDNQKENTKAIRALNEMVGNDDRVTVSLVPIGDGLTLARRKN